MKIQIKEAQQLDVAEIKRMFELMGEYYEGASYPVFIKDLSEKHKVILLLDPQGRIEGFSTIAQKTLSSEGRTFIAIFSGDTVLSRKYWGNGALALAFGRYLFQTKLRNPFSEVYWFLISKGYKTYLLMTNNFPDHYPRFERPTPPDIQKKIDLFYRDKFGNAYLSERGWVQFDHSKTYHLKPSVAEITNELRANPRISFFESQNPQWREGMELACIAKVNFWIPIRYFLKRILKFSKQVFQFPKTNKFRNEPQGALYASHQTQQRTAGDCRLDGIPARDGETTSGVG